MTISAGVFAFVACALCLTSGCGEESPPSDTDQIEAVVYEFVEDVIDGDAEGACEKLAFPPATKESCVPAHLTRNPSLPGVYANGSLRISKVTIHGRRAFVVLNNGALNATQYLHNTRDGWKISSYSVPVRD